MGESKRELVHEPITRSIIGAFFYVFDYLGAGFLESVYSSALTKALRMRGHSVQREAPVEVWFEDEVIALQRIDMVVDGKAIVEIKSGANTSGVVAPISRHQALQTDPNANLLLFNPAIASLE